METTREQNTSKIMNESHLEPRVVRLETGLDILTKNVNDIAISMRENAVNLDKKIGELTVAITTAQAPKKTDWGVFISAVGLIVALGAAVLIPLNNSTTDNKEAIAKNHGSMVEHMKLDMHPVGLALVKRLEEQLAAHVSTNQKELESHMMRDIKEADETRERFKEQLAAQEKFTNAKIALVESEIKGIQSKNDLYIDKLFGRVQVLENERTKTADKEHDELMQWRQKAMGLSSPNGVVPIMTREAVPISDIKK